MMQNDEFYVGYKNKMPPGISRFLRIAITVIAILMLVLIFLLVKGQRPFLSSMCEFQTVKSFEGVIIEKPYPLLLIQHAYTNVDQKYSFYYLVAEGKHGAGDLVRGLDGKAVSLKGSLIYLDGQTMIEVIDHSIQVKSDHGRNPFTFKYLDQGTFAGQIIDSKCYLGVMNPADLGEHRACAIRCISGGIPPLFIVQDKNGKKLYMLLESTDGKSVNQEVLGLVDEPVEITGRVMSYGNLLFLISDPQDLSTDQLK